MADNSTDTGTMLTPDLVTFIRKNTVAELVEGAFYGIEALLAAFVCFMLWNQGLSKSWPRRLLLGTTLLMFVDSTIAVIGDIRFVAVQYQSLVDPNLDPMPTIRLWNTLIAVFCRISYFLGDIIVLWRAWVLYQRNIVIKGVLVFCAVLSLAAVIFVNAVSTVLIGYRAWEHRRFIAAHLETSRRRSQVMQCLVLLVESGAIYCIFWIVILLSMAVDQFDIEAGPYLNVILPHVEAIYPTAIILLTALRKTHCDSTLQTAQVQSQLRFASAGGGSSSSGTVGTGTVSQSVHFVNDGVRDGNHGTLRAVDVIPGADKFGNEDGKERVDDIV
ncbi:hypothetical protein D9758_004698 [Tetrapyrgos nigripes]|uniref:Uncharacterized protein n=1 Tax=Tetrapyrgos nigripes TaxID=182062 RepID=A0A8H5LYS8_9AGAR|nr:hypothetical protein D9758_004698 [Tetrapyrgos nigripes]